MEEYERHVCGHGAQTHPLQAETPAGTADVSSAKSVPPPVILQ